MVACVNAPDCCDCGKWGEAETPSSFTSLRLAASAASNMRCSVSVMPGEWGRVAGVDDTCTLASPGGGVAPDSNGFGGAVVDGDADVEGCPDGTAAVSADLFPWLPCAPLCGPRALDTLVDGVPCAR